MRDNDSHYVCGHRALRMIAPCDEATSSYNVAGRIACRMFTAKVKYDEVRVKCVSEINPTYSIESHLIKPALMIDALDIYSYIHRL